MLLSSVIELMKGEGEQNYFHQMFFFVCKVIIMVLAKTLIHYWFGLTVKTVVPISTKQVNANQHFNQSGDSCSNKDDYFLKMSICR